MILLRRLLRVVIGFLVVVNTIVIGFIAAVLLFGLPTAPGAQPVDARATPRPTPGLMSMGNAHIPTTNACVLCHGAGGEVKTMPAILHPVEGWRRCVQCHTDGKLGRTAPGHENIAEEECLNCHKTAEAGPAITQPHARLHDQRCLDCHGGVAHLPSTMASSSEAGCVLCHKPAALAPPEYPHAPDARLSCRSCHRSAEVGALPIDHALRADDTCLLCHDIQVAGEGSDGSPGSGGSAGSGGASATPKVPITRRPPSAEPAPVRTPLVPLRSITLPSGPPSPAT